MYAMKFLGALLCVCMCCMCALAVAAAGVSFARSVVVVRLVDLKCAFGLIFMYHSVIIVVGRHLFESDSPWCIKCRIDV